MRLIQARVRCVQGVGDSGWFVPGRETTLVTGPPESGKTSFLQALQALNPPYDIHRVDPLAAHPQVWRQGNHTRRVIPDKKTAVCMVFAATTEQVRRLEEIDPALIETDRIEFGRRLDYSRWTSFVEIPSSTRWSEIVEDMRELQKVLAGNTVLIDDDFLEQLRGTDRIKGENEEKCLRWLRAIAPWLAPEQKERYDRCLQMVLRRKRFRLAEKQVAQWLPLTLHLDPASSLRPRYAIADICSGEDRHEAGVVTDLLRLLDRQWRLREAGPDPSEMLSGPLSRVESLIHLFRDNGWPVPQIGIDRRQLSLAAAPDDQLGRRLHFIGTTCLLAQLCRDSRPILLLDCFDRGLSAADRQEMIRFQQRLGSWCQLLSTTDEEAVARADGWQTVLRIPPGGLAAAPLTPA